MTQLVLDLNPQLAALLSRRAEAAGKDVDEFILDWLAQGMAQSTVREAPGGADQFWQDLWNEIGEMPDFPSVHELRSGYGQDHPRATLPE